MGGNNVDFEEQLLSSKGQLCSRGACLMELTLIRLWCILVYIWKQQRFSATLLMKNSDLSWCRTNAPDFQTATFISTRDHISISLGLTDSSERQRLSSGPSHV